MRYTIVFALIALAVAKECGVSMKKGCSGGKCCSYWGYCGTSKDYCGSGKTQCACDCKGSKPCVSGSSSSSSGSSTSTSTTTYYTTDALNIRKGPSTSYGKVKTVARCTSLKVVSISNGWAKLSDGNYCSASYIKTSNPCGSTTVVVPTNGSNLEKKIASVLASLPGSSAKEYGGGSGTQCVELPKYFIDQIYNLGVKSKGLGNGNMMYYLVPNTYPAYFKQYNWSSSFKLLPGDIVSFDSKSSPQYGHAAVVYTGGVGKDFTFLEQWKGSGTVRTNKNPSYYPKVLGVARPIKNL